MESSRPQIFYTDDFDSDMMDFMSERYCITNLNWYIGDKFLFLNTGAGVVWTAKTINNLIGCNIEFTLLTKQRFKEEIRMVEGTQTMVNKNTTLNKGATDNRTTLTSEYVQRDCKELNINLIITEDSTIILDCINSVEYHLTEETSYQDVVNAIRVLQAAEREL